MIEDNFFDFIWCSGVLHHTKDSKKGFEIISKWLKEEGLIIIGVYNTIGRLRTNFRQVIYTLLGKSNFAVKLVSLLDPHLRKNLSKEKNRAWFRDQYEHPVERKHSLDEVMSWFEENNISKERIKLLPMIPSVHGHLAMYNKIDKVKLLYN